MTLATRESIIENLYDAAKSVYSYEWEGANDVIYENFLCQELTKRNMSVVRLKPLPVFYNGNRIDDVDIRCLLIVEDCVFVEINSFLSLSEERIRAEMFYCKKEIALVMNFASESFAHVIKRFDREHQMPSMGVKH